MEIEPYIYSLDISGANLEIHWFDKNNVNSDFTTLVDTDLVREYLMDLLKSSPDYLDYVKLQNK